MKPKQSYQDYRLMHSANPVTAEKNVRGGGNNPRSKACYGLFYRLATKERIGLVSSQTPGNFARQFCPHAGTMKAMFWGVENGITA